MWRIFILGVLLVIVYFMARSALRGLFGKDKEKDVTRSVGPPGNPSDMVQDPVCGTYVDTASALFLTHQDNQFWFCSEACRDKFLTEIKKK